MQKGVLKPASQLPTLLSLLVLVVGGTIVIHASGRSEIIPDRSRFVAFPERIGAWQGHTILIEPEVERGLVGLDDYVFADYKGPNRETVNLYVAYYPSQRKGESPHSPIVCIPGDGWQITKIERRSYAENGVEFPLKRVIIEKNSVRQMVYYWFDERGRKIADEFLAKWYLLADAILMNRTDGALVRITTQIYNGETEEDADQRLKTFLHHVVPILAKYLPSEVVSPIKSVRFGPKGYSTRGVANAAI